MKLQKLIIHNIASIEDATIDFDAKPLSESEVFLITGKTGSGKSTILDAICLALYATTPRLENTEIKGEISDADLSLKVYDTRQMLRRNTGEGFVKLTFIGSNGNGYEAEWSVMRARKRTTGNLQREKWSITNLETGKLYTKKAEIEAEVANAIGLDFKQFCRTTILAQGEFTKFLNSDDNSKATILEKITGVDIYTKIGKKIFELTSSHKANYDDLKRQLEGVKILTDDEVSEVKAKISGLRIEIKQKEEAKSVVDKKLRWIKDDEKSAADIEKTQAKYEQANAKLESEEYRNKQLIISDWNATIEPRTYLSDIQTAKNGENEATAKLNAGYDKYNTLVGGLLWRETQVSHLADELKALQTEVEADKAKAAVYANEQAIESNISIIAGGNDKIKSANDSIVKCRELLTSTLEEDKKRAAQAVKDATDKLTEAKQALDAVQNQLKELDVNGLRAQEKALLDKNNKIEFAQEQLKHLRESESRLNADKQNLAASAKKIEDTQKQVTTLNEQYAKAEIRTETCRSLFEKQQQIAKDSDLIKNLRSKLSIGDTCPVCGKTVETHLHDNSQLAQMLKISEEQFKEAREESENLRKQCDKLSAEVKAETASYELAQKKLAEATQAYEAEKQSVLTSCQPFGIEELNDQTAAALDEAKANNAKEFDAVVEKLKITVDKEADAKAVRDAIDKLQKELDAAHEGLTKADKAAENCNNEIKSFQIIIDDKQREVAEATQKVDSYLTDSDWANLWRENLADFVAKLKSEAKLYNAKVEKLQQTERKLSDCKKTKEAEDNAKEQISAILPERLALTLTIPMEVDNLLTQLTGLYAELKSAQDQLNKAISDGKIAVGKLAEFKAAHTDINDDRLAQLAAIKAETIERYRDESEKIRTNVAAKKTELDQLLKQQQEHLENKPEFGEDETKEALDAMLQEIGIQINAISEQVGALNRDLEQDKNNKKDRGEIIAKIEQAKNVYERWFKLCNLIGDSQGQSFRKVAQSYILGSLIHCANHYMRTLTDRYTLVVTPGTFVISLEDAYQGYARRAATTISGGESFLVSLSLALALADIGKQLAVDTMFIDEGFGTLSGEPLRCAVDTLKSLHSKAGRHVGIISHVEELRERIPVQIQVNQDGNNSSSQIQVVTL